MGSMGSAPGPDDMEKRGRREGRKKDAGVGVVDMPVIAPKGGAAAGSLQPSWESAHPAAPVDRGRDIASACLRPTGSRQAGAGGPRGMTVTLLVPKSSGGGGNAPLDSIINPPDWGVIIGH